jgi:3-hydroxyisobutyrate dehydrogenase
VTGPTVAVLGTGIMGAPMARNLAGAGFAVRAWNRTRARAEPLAAHGVTVAGSVAGAVEGAEFVITMLADGPAVAETMAAALPATAAGAVWIQSATVGPAATADLAAMAAERGIAFVDAPVLGTRQPAEAGNLVVLASGAEDTCRRCEPVFAAVGSRTLWLGEAGAGSRLKLTVNAWLVGLLGALAEAIALAEGIGTDPDLLLQTIAGSAIDAPYAHIKGRAMIDADTADPSFPLHLALKDSRLVAEAARAAGLDLPVAAAVHEVLARAAERGHGDDDMAGAVFGVRPPAAGGGQGRVHTAPDE